MKLRITSDAYAKLRAYVEECPDEISGYGKIEFIDKIPTVTDLMIFTQEVSAGHSDIDDEALGKFIYEMTKAGEDISQWSLWWHSHANMDAFFSGTDTATIERSGLEHDYLFSLVTNKAGETEIRYDCYKPMHVTVEKMVLEVLYGDTELRETIKNEIAEKVSRAVTQVQYKNPKTTSYYGNQRSIYHDLLEDEVQDNLEPEYPEEFMATEDTLHLDKLEAWDVDGFGYYWFLTKDKNWIWLEETEEDMKMLQVLMETLPYKPMDLTTSAGKDKSKSSTQKTKVSEK